MRAVNPLVAMLLGLVACGGRSPGAASGAPAPEALKVRLRFGRPGARLRYATREVERRAVGRNGVITVVFDRTLFVTETFQDSLEARLVTIHLDSATYGVRPSQTALRKEPFSAWFNDQRRRLDTSATDPLLEGERVAIFVGDVPLPFDSVKAGDEWTITTSRVHIPRFPMPESPIHASIKGSVKSIQIVDGDTLVTLRTEQKITGAISPRVLSNSVDIHGGQTADEVFSVHRGATVSLTVKGQLEVASAIMTPAGLRSVASIVRLEGTQKLLP